LEHSTDKIKGIETDFLLTKVVSRKEREEKKRARKGSEP